MGSLEDRLANLSPGRRAALEALVFQHRALPQKERIAARTGSGPAPLSYAQQRLWFIDQLEPGSALYNMPVALGVEGPLRFEVLRLTLGEIVRRHEALRTVFAAPEGSPVQVVQPAVPFELPVVDLSGLPESRRETAATALAGEEAGRPFDLTRDLMLHCLLLRLAEDDHAVLLTMHHIASDGWSMGILVREVAALYAAFAAGRPSPLPELPVQYADFAVWQSSRLSGEVLEREIAWWREQLAGLPPLLALPTDRPRPAVRSFRGAVRPVLLPAALIRPAEALARREGATLFMVLLAGFQALLARHSGQEDLAVGTPVAGRNRVEVEGLIGFFVSTLVLRGDLAGGPSFAELLGRARDTALAAYLHQDVPFEKLVEELAPPRSLAYTPLFQVMLNLQNAPTEYLVIEDLRLRPVGVAGTTAKFDLTLALEEHGGGLAGVVTYATDLFDVATIDRLVLRLERLLGAALAAPERAVAELPLLAPAESHQLRCEWNDALALRPLGLSLPERFFTAAARRPEAVALRLGDEALTYGELAHRVRERAADLRLRGAGAETVTALRFERSFAMVEAALAVLAAGGAFVALDLRFSARLPGLDLIETLTGDSGGGTGGSGRDLPPAPDPRSLAYVAFTSGSTGVPKGILGTHGAVASYLDYLDAVWPLAPEDRVLQLARLSFDASIRDLFYPLSRGAGVVLLSDGEARDPLALAREIEARGVTCLLGAVPSLLHALVEAAAPGTGGGTLRLVLASGEPLSLALCRQVREVFGEAVEIANQYGPSECTLTSTVQRMAPGVSGSAMALAGRPIPGMRCRVLGPRLEEVPAGIVGQVFLGGAGVTRGYLSRPDLTADRFLPDPFPPEPGERLYATGDLGRLRLDGVLELLGRLDSQVKIRGIRLELGEVEVALAAHPEVESAAVAMHDGRLAAYVVARGGAALLAKDLRRFLEERLPEHAVPSLFVPLESLPLTPNGKVDRKALPAPEQQGSGESYVAPRSPVEEILAGIWAELLGLERVGAADHFFDLGGHSLLATRVMSHLRSALAVEMPLRDLFEAPRLGDLAARVEAQLRTGTRRPIPPLVPMPRQGPLPLSFAQRRLWFIDQLEPGSALYNMPVGLRVEGPLRVAVLRLVLSEIVRRHETLRTVFAVSEGREGSPVQVVRPAAPFELPVVDLSGLPESRRETAASALAGEEAGRPFDLTRDLMLRCLLLRLAPPGETADHAVLLTMHHIASDAWSMGILVREVAALYAALAEDTAGRPSPLPELPVQYADFAVWQSSWLCGEVLENEISFWRRELAGLPPLLVLPTDRPRPAVQSFRGASCPVRLPAELTRQAQALARREGATLFMVLLAGFQALLARHSGQENLAVGSPVAGRNRPEIEGLIGFFVNMLVLRGELSGDQRGELSFRGLLGRTRETALAALTHQDLPFERLIEELAPERSLAHAPLFQVVLVLQNAPVENLEVESLHLRPMSAAGGTARFDLAMSLEEHDGLLAGAVEHATDLFDLTTIRRLLDGFERLLAGAVADPDRPLTDLPLLSEAELHQTRIEWNPVAPQTAGRFREGETLAAVFEDQVDRAPDRLALVSGDFLTFGELDVRANRLAHHLRAAGAGPEVPVALCLDRSSEAVVAILAVWKAGACYVPLDPAQPAGRLAFLLEDTAAPLLVSRSRFAASLPAAGRLAGARTVWLDEEASAIALRPAERPAGGAGPGNLAYTIYTSGSTGRPKGVQVEHRPALHLLAALEAAVLTPSAESGLRPGPLLASLNAPLIFDASVQQLVLLLAGHALCIVPEDIRADGAALLGFLQARGVDLLDCTPSHLRLLADAGLLDSLAGPRIVLTAGEAVDESLWRRLAQAERKVVFNLYGPTEGTVDATFHRIEQGSGQPTIGRPLPGYEIFLLDRGLQPVPPGAPGEICLGGAGLARGYLRRPELTAERFVPNAFVARTARTDRTDPTDDPTDPSDPSHPSESIGSRLYRTGDIGRHLPDGSLEFLGRLDHQVKIRGFRIELGEIEAALAALPEVREAVVVVREETPGDRRLVAYVTGDASADALRRSLRERLPDYMVPSSFVTLAALPLTAGGKVDRKSLPDPQHGERDHLAPRTPVEEVLAGIWAEVLGLEQVGADDNFFDLGGHSLLATQVMSRLRSAFGVELPLRDLFSAPRLADLAVRVEAALAAGTPQTAPPLVPVAPALRQEPQPLSFAQQRLWFLDRLAPGNPFYNIFSAARLTGELDVDALQRAFAETVRRHEALRTVFRVVADRPMQVIVPAAEVEVPVIDLEGIAGELRQAESARLASAESLRPFDLDRYPLFRAQLIRLGEGVHELLVSLHHIISDGWSMGILLRELATLYGAFSQGAPSPLPELPVQYADFAAWQRQWLQGERLATELDHWRRQLAGIPEALELPYDHPRPVVESFRGRARSFALPPALVRELTALARRQGATLSMTMLAGFKALLARYSGREDLALGVAIANRTRHEIEGLIGFFVNTLVFRTDLGGAPGFARLIARVRETALAAYTHQDLPFERLVEELQPERDLSRNPLVQVMYGFQNFPRADAEVRGLVLSPPEDTGLTSRTAKFDLTLFLFEEGGLLWGSLEYNRDLFEETTIRRLLAHFERLLAAAVAQPETAVALLPLLSEGERHQLAREWNDTVTAHSAGASLQELFEEQVRNAPGAVAVIHGARSLSYAELNRHANRLAHRLRGLGVGPESRVGLCLERSPEMVVGLLGIVKAGGAYVPLDPDYPDERLALMVEDSGLRALVGEESALARLPGRLTDGAGCILLGADLDAEPGPADDPPVSAGGDSLAYVIYTSGSTGRPKGVMIHHRGWSNLADAQRRLFGLGPGDRVLQFASLSFDASTLEITMAFSAGATLVLGPRERRLSREELTSLLRESTVAILPPAVLSTLSPEDLPGLATLIVAGEACPLELARPWAAGRRFWNAYGPTEDTVCATAKLYGGEEHLTIGRPIEGAQAHVLDGRGNPVPVGVAGELCLGGAGLARGYLNLPGRTAESFVPHPFATLPGERLYRTGDLVQRLPDGEIKFLGRLDHQVKIRGFRIEPGEVEARLAEHPAVLQSYVLAREDVPGDRRLVAYVVEDPAWEARESGAQTEQVSQWREIFDDMYRDEAVADPTFNTIGWDSTYTGLPLPRAEMEEWLEDTVGRIAALAPRRVLEIGCGTGMILFRIAPGCERYTGLDVSGRALRSIESQLGRAGLERSRIELRQGSAEQLGDLTPGSFDTVVVNSVAQYFPSADYLAEVLARAADAVRPGGSVFLGDLRSLPLLAAFHASLELFAAAPETPLAELRQKVQARRRLENELVVDPAFFTALRRRLPRLGRVEVHPKRGVAHNELTAFRYQVVLRLDKAGPAVEVPWLDWRREGWTLAALRRRLTEAVPEALGLRNVPNARSAEAGAAARLLAHEESGTAGDLRRLAAEAAAGAVEPQEIWDLARELPYEVELGWASPGDSGCFDAVLRKCGGDGQRLSSLLPEPRAAVSGSEPEPLGLYTNHPLQGRFARRFAPELSAFLQARLPDYMVPSAFVLLDALPLNANGKIDRRRLPAPDAGRLESGRPLVAPRNATEERLVGIWRDLLGVERIGVEDDFFELGGHSLLATQAVSRVREAFGVELPLRTFFESPTAAAVAALVGLHREGGEAVPPVPPILPVPRDGRLPLSFAQERLWFLHHLDTRLLAYNESAGFRLEGRLEEAALRWSLDEMLRRHEALRTVFPEVEGFAVQRILPAAPFAILSVDLRALPGELREREARRLAAEQMRRRFDLAEGPLVHGLLARLDDRDHAAVFFFHHIVFDGWSRAVFAREFSLLYAARCAGRPSPLPPLPVQYADFAVWQREWLRGEVFERQLAYWRERLAGIAVLDLPTDRPRPAAPASPGDWLPFHLPPALTESLRAFSRDRGHTLFMTLLAAFQALLHRSTGQLEVTVGTPIANRHRGELENLIGFFVNMIVLRLDLSGDPSFAELAARAHGVALGAYEHQDMPFDKLVFELQPERDLRYTPLFQVGFQLLKVPDARLDLPGLAVSAFASVARFAKFDLNLAMSEEADLLTGVLDYDTDLFDRSTALRLLDHFEALLEAVAAAPAVALSAVPLLRDWERHQLLVEWSGGPELQTPPDATLPALFARQVARTPEATALLWQGDVWTFRELAGRAGRLARHLCSLGIGPETRVGVCAERGPDLVCALLGVLEAGAAYVPLDPAWPQQRLATLIEDARAPFLLLSAGLAGRIQAGAARRLVLEDLLREAPPEVSGGMRPLPENLAYVIYTSGSTGRPKGVAVRHSSVSALLRWAPGAFGEDERRKIVAATSVCFDLSVFELFLPLTTGGTVVLAGNPLDIARRAAETEATLVNTVPSILSEVLRSGPLPASVSTVALAGEPLPAALAAALHRAGTVRRVVNLYGPSEDTTYSTIAEIGPEEAGAPPIGRPIDGTRAYVLDAALRPVLPGVPGELCLAGEGLARGYLHRPERTAESFLPDPFAAAPGSRMYRTGDLARFRPGGRLEFLGRVDHQVKIRGVRIELGEIEATLAALPGIREAVVVVREDVPGDRRLVAYVTGDAPVEETEELRGSLRGQLPDVMVPSAFVTLAALPLTPSGKVDRKALLSPGAAPGQQGSEERYVAPRTPVEEALAGIWTELLGRERVGAADHFFDLGGHSLLAVRLMARIEQSTGVKLPLAALFEAPTVERLAEVVQRRWAPDDRSPLVHLHPGGAGRPLFLAHPVGGDVFAYVELARRLGADRPVYGLQAISEGNGHQPRKMEELAAQYLAAVREVQAEGPYLLAGWSLGAVIAYEMAQQIESSGGTVGLLAMLDPSSPAAEPSELDETALLAGFAADLVRLSGRPVAFGPEVLAGLDLEAGLDRVLELGRGEGVLPPEIDRARLRERFERFSRHLRALYGYTPRPYGGRVALFRASASLRPEDEGAAPGWSALARAEIHLFEADHYTLLQSPALDGLVEQLKADLRVEDEPRP